jgi:hypothetical protein
MLLSNQRCAINTGQAGPELLSHSLWSCLDMQGIRRMEKVIASADIAHRLDGCATEQHLHTRRAGAA